MINVQIVITQKDIQKYDKMQMSEVYNNWPEMARQAYSSTSEVVDFKNIDHIVYAGMGGSGAIGDIFASILSKTNIHVTLVKGYQLPKTVDKNTLSVITSISGNTDESVTILKQLKKNKHKCIAFSSGGQIEKFCIKNQIFYKKFNQNISPRASFTTFVYGILSVLSPIIPIKKNQINESLFNLQKISQNISSNNLTSSNQALNLALWIKNIPVIYYPSGLQSAAIRFKNSLQENSKTHVIAEDVIEACHNGIVAWEKDKKLQPIMIKGKDDHIKTKQRWDILKEYFEINQIKFKEINSVEGGILTKIMNLIYLFDYTSIYLGVVKKIDPSAVDSIDFIKNKLNSK